MAKSKTEIHVTTVFDGELDATDVFVSLIAQKYSQRNNKEYLAKKQDLEYNKDKVTQYWQAASGRLSIAGFPRTMTLTGRAPVSQTSGICWKTTARSRDGRLLQSIRTMVTRG